MRRHKGLLTQTLIRQVIGELLEEAGLVPAGVRTTHKPLDTEGILRSPSVEQSNVVTFAKQFCHSYRI